MGEYFRCLPPKAKIEALGLLSNEGKIKSEINEIRNKVVTAIRDNMDFIPPEAMPGVEDLLEELANDGQWDVRIEAIEAFIDIIEGSEIKARVRETHTAFRTAFQSKVEEIFLDENNSLAKLRQVNLPLFNKDALPMLLAVYSRFPGETEKLIKIIKLVLSKRGFLGLFRFIDAAQRLENKDDIESLAEIYLLEKALPAIKSPDEAKVSYWLGRSLIVPLGSGMSQIFKYPRKSDPENALKNEEKRINELAPGLNAPLWDAELNDEFLTFKAGSRYYDYADNSFPWLSHGERLSRFDELCGTHLTIFISCLKRAWPPRAYCICHIISSGGRKVILI